MKQFFKLAVAAILSLTLASCFDEPDAIITNSYEFVTVSGDHLISDQGVTYYVVEDESDQAWAGCERLFVLLDVLRLNSQGNGYEIRIHGYAKAEMKAAKVKSLTSEDACGKEPVAMYEGWGFNSQTKMFSLSYVYAFDKTSNSVHFTNIVFDDERSAGNDTVFLKLAHQGNGEILTDTNSSNIKFTLGYGTFDLTEAFGTRKGSVPVKMEYDWYKEDSYGDPTPELQHYSTVATFAVQ